MIKEINEAYDSLTPSLKEYFNEYCWNYDQAYLYYSEHWAYTDRSDEKISLMAIDHVLGAINALKTDTYGAY
jgi:hypothetical protein